MFLPTHDLIYIDDICKFREVSKISNCGWFYFDTDRVPNRVNENVFVSLFRNKHENTPAIYRMYDKKGELVYIGESLSVYKRLKQHLSNSGMPTPVKNHRDDISKIAISFFPIKGKDDIREVENKLRKILIHSIEQYFIMTYNPKYNGTKPTKPQYVKMKAINSFKLVQLYEDITSNELLDIFGGKTNDKIRTVLTFLNEYIPDRFKATV